VRATAPRTPARAAEKPPESGTDLDGDKKVVVVGAGIAGLSVARALQARGVDVTVLAPDHGMTARGAGIVAVRVVDPEVAAPMLDRAPTTAPTSCRSATVRALTDDRAAARAPERSPERPESPRAADDTPDRPLPRAPERPASSGAPARAPDRRPSTCATDRAPGRPPPA